MQKLLVSLIIMMIPLCSAFADDYPYFTFTGSDGSVTTLSSSNLEITFSNGKMVATNGTDNISLSLASLSSMAFSQTTTGIQSATTDADEEIDVYSTAGIHMGHYANADAARQQLTHGVYVFKSKSQTIKTAIR